MFPYKKFKPALAFLLLFFLCISKNSNAQMRQVYFDQQAANEIRKTHFYTPSEGYVAFKDWIGYTADTGRTFTQRPVTGGNVNYNGYNVNITFGFTIKGVHGFNQNILLVYGDYGFVPAILRSTDGGLTFTLVYYSQFDPFELSTGIMDVAFAGNGDTGYAIDADRILKTTNQGITWSVIRTAPNSCFDYIEMVANDVLYVVSDGSIDNIVFPNNRTFTNNKILKTVNGGSAWQTLSQPAGFIKSGSFISQNTGWLNIDQKIFYSNTGGNSWEQKNVLPSYQPFSSEKIKFINDSTGYAIELFDIKKTTDSGKIWEPLVRDNNYNYLGFGHNDLYFFSPTQLWAGGYHGLLELSTNAGGTSLPVANFGIDTLGMHAGGEVRLVSYSRQGYGHRWFKNGVLISSDRNTSYQYQTGRSSDTIRLIINNNLYADTAEVIQYFSVPNPPVPTITSFTPLFGSYGDVITINGTNFAAASAVAFGGLNAQSFTIVSPNQIKAVLGIGNSGSITVTTPYGTASRAGFTSRTPRVFSFTPATAGTNTTVTITGNNFLVGTIQAVKFGGIPAASFSVVNNSSITAVVGAGASGFVSVQSSYGKDSLAGFNFIPPPTISSFAPSTAGLGETVTISGANFNGVTNVKFGDSSASTFTIVSASTITAVVAAGASGNVSVISARGTGSLAGFNYLGPVITAVIPSVAAEGTLVSISGTGFSGATAVSFGGVPAASFTVNSPVNISAVVGSGQSGKISVQTPLGISEKPNFVFVGGPYIASFTPAYGPIGTTVEINGANFGSVSGTTVWFGATKAEILSVAGNKITVKVPYGSSYKPISVTTNNLTCTSKNPFLVTFPDGALTANTYMTYMDIKTPKYPSGSVVTDLDLDGKPDVIIKAVDTICIYRNISTPGQVKFAQRIDRQVTASGYSIREGDLDNDGKKDLVYVKDNIVYALKNQSTPGNILFGLPQNIGASAGASDIEIADLNADGKEDIAISNYGGVIVLKNISSANTVAFVQTSLSSSGLNSPYSMVICDLDMDGRPDIAVSNYYVSGAPAGQNVPVFIFRNTSNGSDISFAPSVTFGTQSGIYSDINAGDVDGDGMPDLIYGETAYFTPPNTLSTTNKMTVLRNQSMPGNLAFNRQLYNTSPVGGDAVFGVVLDNMNGDQKPDILSVNGYDYFNILNNTSTINNVILSTVNTYATVNGNISNPAVNGSAADLDGDGRPDIILVCRNSDMIRIFKNQETFGLITGVCFNGSCSLTSNLSGNAYQWQENSGSGFVNVSDNSTFSGTTTPVLTINGIVSGLQDFQYRCKVNQTYSNVFQLKFINTWTGAISNQWENAGNWSCNTVPDLTTDVVINSGNVVISSNVTIHTLSINASAILNVGNGFSLTITH